MTGYGRGEAKNKDYGSLVVEVQGVNRKYCDIHIHLPHHLLILEQEMRKLIQEQVARGRINVFVSFTMNVARKANVHIDKELVRQYFSTLQGLKKELKLKGDLDLSLVAGLKDILVQSEVTIDPQAVWPTIEKALNLALKNFNQTRKEEGTGIAKQITGLLTNLGKRLEKIEIVVPKLTKQYKERLVNRIRELGVNISDADERIQKEVAILAEHIDITEELQRSRAHLAAFQELYNKDDVVGRTMDFLVQELLREANTIGSKAMHTEISADVIFIKSQLEKIREQIQNIE